MDVDVEAPEREGGIYAKFDCVDSTFNSEACIARAVPFSSSRRGFYRPAQLGDSDRMCKEQYRRWEGCNCWGFIEIDACSQLFKTCLGPSGEADKVVVEWNDGMCGECWDRLMEEAREMAEAEAKEASTSSRSN